MKSKIVDLKKPKVRAIQIQFKGEDEIIFFDLRRIALDFDLDQTGLSRLILTEWVKDYKARKTNKEKNGPYQLPLFTEKQIKKAGIK
jgi:hypothetical protein